jgi:curved DNA-binding protein CbpA
VAVDDTDLYRLLQVDPEAEVEVIRAAYRTLAAKHHPDVGGSASHMAELNGAMALLSNPVARAGYDRQRLLQHGGGRWDAFATGATRPVVRSSGRILEFGRFAGWSIPEVARTDPDFLEWFERTPNGRRYRDEIDAALGRLTRATAVASAPPRERGRWH